MEEQQYRSFLTRDILLAVIKYKRLSIRNVKVTPGFGEKAGKGAAASPPEQHPAARHHKEGCLP